VAFQFLSVENPNGSFEFGWSFGLLLPIAVRDLLAGPANQVRRYDVRVSASQTFALHHIEIPGCGFRVRNKFGEAGHV
jgi:hypothetical protein